MFPLQLLLLLLLQTLSVPSARALYFEDGFDHHYTYSSESDILGMHNVTTVIKFRIRSVNDSLYMLMVDSFVQHSESGYIVENALKWKLDRKFFFNAGQDGLVTLVHFHPEEKNEVLSLKKVLASTLSTKVTIGPEDNYVSEEEDHTGVLEHEYTQERHTDGVRITKGHKSSETVHRSHNKTVHLDSKGTPLHVESLDNVTLWDEPSALLRTNVDDAEEIPEDISGEFPKIGSVSISKMKLTAKNKHYESSHHNIDALTKDTLLIKQVPKAKKPLSAVESDIQKYVACIHAIPNKYDVNRTECVHELRNLVTSLEREDFLKLGNEALTKECLDDDIICIEERNLFIDIIADEGGPDSQLLVLNNVMLHPNVSEEDIRRCLFHCIAIKSPVMELVEYVEELCFDGDPKPGETPAMSKNRIRACLSLGAMAKSLHKENATVSDRIVERIENQLEHHDEVKFKSIVKPRRRRSIIQHDMKARKHVETKMVLIQSLGNAGKQRSLEHIKSYMEPNVGVTALRRAAIHSLRDLNCPESINHLVISAVHDDNEVVRKAAIHVLKKRQVSNPEALNVEHENMVLSKNYSYPVALRLRRGLLETLEKGINVHIELPGFQWDKVIGSRKIGASFGITIRNLLDLKLGLLDGHFMVDIYDGAYAEAHVGLINLNIEILKAYVCFNGHIRYDLNVLKDFGINSLSDLVHIYDKIIGKIINPIMNAVTNFRKIIIMFKNDGLTKIINTLVSTVKNLPTILGDVASRMEDFVKDIFSIAGSTIMDEIRTIVMHVRQFVDSVKVDILDFYNRIVDAITMGLPYIGKKIVEAFNLIVEGMRALFTNPMQGITAMSRAISDVKMAVAMFSNVRTSIVDACSFIKGRAAAWLNTAKEIPSILKRLAEAFKRLTMSIRNRRDLVEDMTNRYSNGIEQTKDSLVKLEEDLKAKWEQVIAPLKPLMDIAKPFIEAYKSVMDIVDAVKLGYKIVKDTIETSKKLVQKVFGPKFHRSFPTDRRPRKGSCPEGIWPSTTEGYYDTTGVDLRLGKGQTIKMPVNGILHVEGNQRVVVQPTDAEFLTFEIIIENIILNPGIADNKSYPSGEKIGRAGKAPKCEPNFIHVSVRLKVEGRLADRDYQYTDPGPFLDRLVPMPKWIQECNDHEFRYIGQTFESGESSDDEEPDESKEPVSREPDSSFGGMDDMGGSDSPEYRPDDPSLYDQTAFGDSLLESLKEQAKKFADFFKTALFGDSPQVPNILDIVDMSKKKVDYILDALIDVTLKKELNGVVDGLCNKMTAVPVGNPLSFSIPYVKSLLEMHGLPPVISDMSKLSDQLMNIAENECSMFKGAIAKGFGHVCTVQEDCLGLVCSVPLPKGGKIEYVLLGAILNPTEETVVITVNGKSIKQIIAGGGDIEFDLNIQFFEMKLYMAANLEFKQGVFFLSAEAKLCQSMFHVCLPGIELFHEIKFQALANIATRGRRETGKLAMCTGITALTIPKFLNKLGDFQQLGKNITGVIDKVRSTVVTKLLEDATDRLGALTEEFTEKVDFCLSANIAVPPFDKKFIDPDIDIPFAIGPVPMSLGFGAGGSIGLGVRVGLCVLSMTTQLTLTPWVGGKVRGDISVNLGFAKGGLRLIGYLMETKFPMTTELVFSKYPIDVGSRMDLILTPIRLELHAFAQLNLLFTTVTVFDANIWEYACPTIKKNIFHKKKRDDDPSPPDIMPATISERSKREGVRGCIVHQVVGRPHYSPAFTLEMHAQDEVSEVKLFYAIGSHPGGTNIVAWTEMGGNSLMAPGLLPGGIPLYWTVKAKNSQGLEATVQCSLNTFDSTLPDGRVEHSYTYSSHPYKLSASVIVVEDSPLIETHYKAVGLSPGQFGSQFVNWEPLRLDQSVDREGVSGYLKHFTVPREGKLVTWVLQSQELRTPELCAQKCIQYGQNCMSFSYEYHSETCDLHDIVEGANAYLRISGTYSNYERLGVGYNTPIEYDHLELTQGTLYFVNTKVTNVLGYEAYLTGQGTMVDFTPPEPGLIRNAIKDILQADNCTAAITQRCIDVTWKDNHRIIIDGEGSGTVFNGHEPVFDQLYTLTNHYVTANWKGFHDDESDIWGYTWAVGSAVCGSDIMAFEDPYSHLTNKKFWTDSAFHKGIHLEDGAYYVTVQALNGAELGGSLVTTVCHSTPFIVDTSPPVFNSVTDIIYDEDFDLIAIYYDAEDSLSKIAKAEFGLGKTKYDVQLKPYSLHASMDRDDPFVAVEDLGLQEGIPAWLRIRVTNNVDLFTAGHGDEPIMIDKSPPTAGTVFDGDRLRQDRTYQSDNKHICAQWINFYDEQSGIDRFLWGVGTAPKLNDVVAFRNLTHYDKSSCAPASLQHNHTYFSTVFAYNNALNSKSCNSSSDGVLVDITPPLPGDVFDGKAGNEELKYTSETVSKYANWRGYHDPESGIAEYKVDVYVNGEHKKTFDVDTETEFKDHTISMDHLDQVHFTVHGVNGAELEVTADSDGFLVDHTPPVMTAISDNDHGSAYQSYNDNMQLSWNFYDSESHIKEYRTVIYQTKHGVKQKFWPENAKYNTTSPPSPTNGRMAVKLENLAMTDGALYTLHVTTLNNALLATSHETTGVTVDTTPPGTPTIRIGLPKEEEEVDELGRVLHNDQHAIRLSWSGRDSESGIEHYLVAIGTEQDQELISHYVDYGIETTAFIQHINFQTFSDTGITYVAYLKATNGAGLESDVGHSKPILVQKANIPGVVFDGRDLFTDAMYTIDGTSIAASFYGFESESCNIISYEWAIGTTEYYTDVLSYTDYGVVMLNDTHGQAQVHIELFEDTTYYITVRAVTGCHDEFILAASDGITFDRTPPVVVYKEDPSNDSTTVFAHGVLFQDVIDTLAVTSNVSDKHSVDSTSWALGSLPLLQDRHPFSSDLESLTSVFSQQPGEATFITTDTVDKAGNREITSSFAIMSDDTAPQIKDLQCTEFLSYRKSLLTCDWVTLVEYESLIDKVTVTVTTNEDHTILDEYTVPRGVNTFTRDLYHELNRMKNVTRIYATFVISNIVGQKKDYGQEIVVDVSKPDIDKLEVVTSLSQTPAESHQKCQLPRAFLELRVRGAKDEESEIDTERYEVSLGLKPYGTEFKNYVPIKQRVDGTFFLDDFTLNVGTVFYATLRVCNKAGLYSDVTSESVVVSQAPRLTVIDGDGEEDVDYQAVPNLIQGHWQYSDPCPIREAKWMVEDLTGKVIFDYMTIPSSGRKFYNDEVTLENGKKYITTVKTIDFLNRTRIARSDGITVRIQPPFPGHVRDGVAEDMNYQYSTTELSCNWDPFGDNSNDPTQSIHHYEVSIGNDRRYEKTRSNVHYFENVGLNTSHTFKHLNLTGKLIRYYITVRSYSMAGGYAEGYSNGIRVGYHDEIGPGEVSLSSYQSQVDSIAVSWTGFKSDINILLYKVGISSQEPDLSNDTLKCSHFGKNVSVYDVSDLESVGLNEYVKVEHLSLEHGKEYYVTVIAEDEAGMCIAVTSMPVLIDTTQPVKGDLYINGVKSDIISFATSDSEMQVRWENFNDAESGIPEIKISLLECSSCHPDVESQECKVFAENVVHDDVKTAFYDIELYPSKSYVVRLDLRNGANLHTVLSSATILIDSTPPLPGEVKISNDWNKLSNFQHSTTRISGLFALASTHEDYVCKNQIPFFPSNEPELWQQFSDSFSDKFQVVNSTGAYLGIGYDTDLITFQKSGIVSDSLKLAKGNYSFTIRTARGNKIVTTTTFLSDAVSVPFELHDKPEETVFDYSLFDNMTGLQASNDSGTLNTTELPTTTKKQSGEFVPTNKTDSTNNTFLDKLAYGCGIHLLGYKIGNNKDWWHVFWARSKFASLERWFRLPFDPTLTPHEYTINVKQDGSSGGSAFDLTLYVDGEEVVSISGFDFNSNIKFSSLVWNEDDYKPPIASVFKPFYSEATLSRIDIPDETDKQCLHGKGFYDGESGIKEIQIGVSDSTDEIGNIRPLQTYQSFCFPCIEPCDDMCQKPCNDTKLSDGFTLFPVEINALDLETIGANSSCLNVSMETKCNSTVYYLNAKIVNFAGEETVVNSNGIQIDTSPPECEYVRCVDPAYNGDQPTKYLGSNSSIGAYWNCKEDVSLIDYYTVKIVSINSSKTIMKSTKVNLQTKVAFDLGGGTFEDRNFYEVQLTATNTAGLSLESSCTIEVLLFAPDVSSTSFKPLFTDGGTEADGEAAYFTSSQNSVGLQWAGGNNEDIEFYEYAIGASQDAPDILPPTLVGESPSGTVAISGGRLKLDTTLTNTSMLDLLDRRNMTNEELADLEAAPEHKKTLFNIEPGRCMHQTLYAVGYSHRKSKIQGKTVCNKRVNDVNSGSSNNTEVIISKAKYSRKWEKNSLAAPEIVIDAQVLSGSMSVGSLDEADKTSEYGSAATADFKPYISDPSLTGDQTTRMLRNRIQKFCDMSFYMAPSPAVDVEYVKINVTVPSSCSKDPDYQPALVYWDVENQVWTHIDEGCSDVTTSYMDFSNGVYMAEVCTQNVVKRRRRDTTSTMSDPINIELTQISRAFPNSPPTIVSDVLYTQEDNFKELLVETNDPDNDNLIFELLSQPENATCTLGYTTGMLNCTLEKDFNGLNYMDVKVTESGLPGTEQPMSVMKTVMLNITATPDATERFFLDRFGTLLEDVRPSLVHSLTVEANRTETVFAGTIVLADMDDGEVFIETTEFTALGNATFSLEKVDGEDLQQMENTSYKTLQAYNVTFKYSSQLHGNMTLNFIAQTATGARTPSVTLNVFVLENPCIYGSCDHLSLGTSACESIDRAISFNDNMYICVCTPGYKGTWCQIEIDECESNQCSPLYDCEDLVNDYECNINVGKLMAILICCSLALVGAGFFGYKLKQRLDRYRMRMSQVSLTDDDQPNDTEIDSHPQNPFLTDKVTTPTAVTNPGFNKSDDIDLSALSMFTHIVPPHHTHMPYSSRTSKPSFVPGTDKFNPGKSNPFGHRSSKPSFNRDSIKPKWPPMPTETPAPTPALMDFDSVFKPEQQGSSGQGPSAFPESPAPAPEPGFVSVFKSEQQGPSRRCASASSQRSVCTIGGEQIMLSDKITDVKVCTIEGEQMLSDKITDVKVCTMEGEQIMLSDKITDVNV